MNKNTRSALRTARSLMAKGIIGEGLWQGIIEAHQALSEGEKKKLTAALKKEVGILGQLVHNPNLYPDCRTAKVAKEDHPHPHTLILTSRTPMCGSCEYNRNATCTLMGGSLTSKSDEIEESTVLRTAKILVNEGQLTQKASNRIVKANLPGNKRVAALHLRKIAPERNPQNDISGRQDSRRVSAMMDQTGVGIDVEYAPKSGPRYAVNGEDTDVQQVFAAFPGDKKVAKKARRLARYITRAELTDGSLMGMDPPKEPRQDVTIAAGKTLRTTEKKLAVQNKDVHEENMRQAQVSHDKTTKLASKLMRSGRMTVDTAERITAKLDELRTFGAVQTPFATRIATQLNAMSGGLEL